jgi:4-aminobutyrate aminotransferase/(S)-3-amino-2-methylpropionate transaminase
MTNVTTHAIQIKTDIPGPKSKAILDRRGAAVPKGLGLSMPIVVERAHGALVTDIDGNTFLDFAGGIGVLAAGHTPAPVVAAIQAQAESLLHICAMVAVTENFVALAEKLNAVTPGNFAKKTVISNTGAEAIENAIRTAREATGRPAVICFEGAYHGRSLLTATLTSKYDTYKKNFGPFATDIYKLPFPYLYRRPDVVTEEQYIDMMIAAFDHALTAQVDPSAVAAVIIEPVQGEGGYIPTPVRYLQHLAKRCQQHGIVLIIDEVQTGFGRTGTLFAIEQYGVEPDILVTAKSLGAGMPVSAITGRADLMEAVHVGGYGGTYGGNPLACAAALQVVDYIIEQDLAARAVTLGGIMRAEFERWQGEFPLIGDVRGLGAMLALEFVDDAATKHPAKEQTAAIVNEAAKRGLILLKTGLFSNCVRFLMPLTIPEPQLYEGMAVLEEAIRAVVR